MKKSTIKKIEKEINEKTKLPNEVKEKIKKEVFTNIMFASVIILYLIFIVLGSVDSIKNVRAIDLNIFSILFLGITIFLFEIAYKRDNGKLAMYGIESLVVAIFTLFLPYIIFELNKTEKKYYLMASIYIASYYILKSIAISIKTKNKYMNTNISDIKEILKKEKRKRRIKEDIDEVEVKDEKNVGVDAHIAQGPKKRGRPKKENSNKDIEKEESTPKKRGRPKKSETTKNENKPNVGVAPQDDPKPKKRGRPRKVDINND